VLDVETTDDRLRVAQSNTILRFAGRLTGLYPVDEAVRVLKVDEVLDMCEDIYQLLTPSFHEPDNDRKMAMRKTLAEETLPRHANYLERLLVDNGSTGFLVGDALTVADLKLYWLYEFLTNGSLDGIPTTLLDSFPTLSAWYKNITRVRENHLSVA
jgi:glutathione S-transferase